MKNKFIILLTILCTVLVGCEVESPEEIGTRTQRGKQIYDSWQESFSRLVINSWLDQALRFNAYYCATGNQKYVIEDSLLSAYKIRQTENDTWNLLRENTVYRTYNCTEPINQVGATWICTYRTDYDDIFFEPNAIITYTIACVGSNTWRIQSSSNERPVYIDMAIEAESTPATADKITYNLLGDGIIPVYYPYNYYNSKEYIQFSTLEAMHRTTRGWSCGKLELDIFDTDGDSLETTAVFKQSHNNYAYSVEITYRGVTETYTLNN